jgi:hypothetical protein
MASDVSTTDGEAEEKPKARASRHANGGEHHCLNPIARKRGRTRGRNHSDSGHSGDSGHSSGDGEDRNEVPLSRFRGSEHASTSCASSLSNVAACQAVRKPGRCPAQRGAGGKELEEGGAEGEEEEEEEERILHPTFEKPLFKGVEEALVLGYEEVTAEEAEIEGGMEGMDRGRGATGVVMDASPGPPVRQRPVTVPLAASRYLYEYQKEGVRWLYARYAGRQGCILGDAMGLGKTVQVVALLLALFARTGERERDREALRARVRRLRRGHRQEVREHAVLIVAPASVTRQWVAACRTWGAFALALVGGRAAEGREALEEAKFGAKDVVVCSYEFMAGKDQACLRGLRWRMVVFDEFHRARNRRSQLSEAARGLRARVKIGLTGTVIQNNLGEEAERMEGGTERACTPGEREHEEDRHLLTLPPSLPPFLPPSLPLQRSSGPSSPSSTRPAWAPTGSSSSAPTPAP